jgi:hypothetical protein
MAYIIFMTIIRMEYGMNGMNGMNGIRNEWNEWNEWNTECARLKSI